MTKQLQQAIQANTQLQTKNAKLYEDNRALARIASNQNHRVAFLNASDNAKLQQFTEMRDKMQALSNERAELQRKTDALLKGKAVDNEYQTLVSELQTLREKHETLLVHHSHLRNDYTRLYSWATTSGILRPDGTPSGRVPTQIRWGPSGTKCLTVLVHHSLCNTFRSNSEQRPTMGSSGSSRYLKLLEYLTFQGCYATKIRVGHATAGGSEIHFAPNEFCPSAATATGIGRRTTGLLRNR